jgi:hypothetical protein
MPNVLASFDRATIQPSLFDNTTTGLPIKSGRKSRSHEAKKLLQSTSAQSVSGVFLKDIADTL